MLHYGAPAASHLVLRPLLNIRAAETTQELQRGGPLMCAPVLGHGLYLQAAELQSVYQHFGLNISYFVIHKRLNIRVELAKFYRANWFVS